MVKTKGIRGVPRLTIFFMPDAWEYAREHARAITITQETCKG